MIYLTKSFTCVIVSRWCNQIDFQSVFEVVKAWGVNSIYGQQKARKMYSKDKNSYVIFVGRGYVDAFPTVASTREAR